MGRKVRKSAEEIDRDVRHELVQIVLQANKSAYHKKMAALAESFIDYIDVKHRVLPRDHPIKVPKV